MLSIKNWDNKTWISSAKYILSFNNFLLKQKKLTKNSKILDIGCGRGKIMGSLSSKLKLINKPIGLDIESHKDFDKRIIFKKINAIKYLKDNKNKFTYHMNSETSFNPHNMFICKTEILKKYYDVVFPWLEKCENQFGFDNLRGYDTKRMYAYLAERYLSFWFKKYTVYKEQPWVFIQN